MAVTYGYEQYKNYGKVLAITNGIIDIKVTVDVGPRVIYYALCGKNNVMFNDDERSISRGGEAEPDFVKTFGDRKWYIYGGHRIWASPEDYPLSYYPDNDPVDVKIEGDTFTFTPPRQDVTDYQYTLLLTVDAHSSHVGIENRIRNTSCGVRNIAAWALTVLTPGGLEIIPQPKDYYQFLSNREIVLWPYSNMADERVFWGKDFITLRSVKGAENPFKLGINLTPGWALYAVGGSVFKKSYCHNIKTKYPDRGVSFETYTFDQFLECETVGELCELLPGEECFNREGWDLYSADRVPDARDEKALAEFCAACMK